MLNNELEQRQAEHQHRDEKGNPDHTNKVIAVTRYSKDITENQISEERIRQSEAHLAEAQRLAKLGSWNYDIKTDKLTWSEELYNVFGTDKRTFNETHRSFLDLIDEEDRGFALQTSRHTQETGEPFTIEYRITTPKGEKRIIRELGYGQTDDNGKVVRLFGTAQDITEQKKAEIDLKEAIVQLSLFKAIVNSSDDAIISITLDGIITSWNRGAENIFGYTSEEALCKSISILIPSDLKREETEIMTRIKRGESVEHYETERIKKDGSRIHTSLTISPVLDPGGIIIGASKIVRDITGRKKAEKTLMESENYLRTIIQTEPHCVKLLNINCELENMNPAGLEMVEAESLEHIKGKSVIALVNEPYRKSFKNLTQNVFKGKSETLEFEITGLKGTRRWMQTYAVPLKNAEGKILSLLGISLDITERKKAEEDLQQVNEELRMLSSHLQNVREEERIQIARNVHDELGQQLTGLKLEINWLKRKLETEDEPIKEKINGIIDLVDKTLQSVRRISSDLRPSLLDDFGLIAALEWHSEEVAKRSEIQVNFTAEIPEVDIPVPTETGLFRIYQELLTNAVRHSNAKVITSSLQLKDNQLLLKVKDNGQGMDPLTTDTKKTLGFIGIKERTFALAGKFEIKSQPGKGTEVQISISL